MKLSSSIGLKGARLQSDFSTQSFESKKLTRWLLTATLFLLSVNVSMQDETLRLVFVTFPMSVALASFYGSKLRMCLVIGYLPLLVNLGYQISDDYPFSISVSGGPFALYFANILAYDFFSSTSKRRSLLAANGNFESKLCLLMVAFFYFPEFNTDGNLAAQSRISFSFDPFIILVFLFFLYGMRGRLSPIVPTLLLIVSIVSILSLGMNLETFQNRAPSTLIFSELFFQRTYADIGKILSMLVAFPLGWIVREAHRRRSANPMALIFCISVIFSFTLLGYFRLGIDSNSFSYGYVIFGNNAFDASFWPVAYEDSILREHAVEFFFVDSIFWFGTQLEISTEVVGSAAMFATGYVWRLPGAIAASAVWLCAHLTVFSGINNLPALASVYYNVEVSIVSDVNLFTRYSNTSSVLEPLVNLGASNIWLAPDFVFALFGAWLGAKLSIDRRVNSSKSASSSFYAVLRPDNPLLLVGAWTGIVLFSYQLVWVLGMLSAWLTAALV